MLRESGPWRRARSREVSRGQDLTLQVHALAVAAQGQALGRVPGSER